MAPETDPLLDQLARSLHAVGALISAIRPEQWGAQTPCSEWPVRRVVTHLVGMNLVFTAMLADQPLPRRGDDLPDDQLDEAYRASAIALLGGFGEPGVLDQTFHGPFGPATGAERLQIRLYDLLAHGWDIAQATGQAAQLPDDAATQALVFAQGQLSDDARPGRFAPSVPVDPEAPALDRLVAFLGRQP